MTSVITATLRALIDASLAIAPIVALVALFQFVVIRRPLPDWRRAVAGLACLVLGLAILLQGLEMSLFPLGDLMARQLTAPEFVGGSSATPGTAHWYDYYWVCLFAAALAFAASIAEPAVIAVAGKVHEVSGGAVSRWGLRLAVAVGVAIGLLLGAFKVILGVPLYWFLLPFYLLLLLQTRFAPRGIISIAYDSGGVTTSIITVPLVTALGLGLARALPGRDVLVDGFGLVAFACLFPIMSVMGYAQISVWLARRTRAET
ncbi:MAG TPA: DUF1538 domain-containing protein [Nevskiaceae bacterium]